jgi:hypothetical protein
VDDAPLALSREARAMLNLRISRPWLLLAAALCACDTDSGPSLESASGASLELGTSRSALSDDTPVGLSLFFREGAIQPISLVGDMPRFLQEIDIVSTVVTPTDQGAAPLVASAALGNLDWSGLAFVEEDWRAPGDGTWTRQRFFRGARWMQAPSIFVATAKDAHGHRVGAPIVFYAGRDDHWNERHDDGFVRRFDVRQIVKGCRARLDCTNATSFAVEGLVQARQEQFPERKARRIPHEATALELFWTADPTSTRVVPVTHAQPGDFPYGYGFVPTIELLTAPANGQFYLPGDALPFRVSFFDGSGRRLNTSGSLPTYQESLAGAAAGIRFWDPTVDATLYYALKHREANMVLQVSGPADKLAVPQTVVDTGAFFAPQVTIASVNPDGFSAFALVIPPLPTILGGFSDPSLWQIPNSDVQTLTVPADALPGSYTAVIKARRDWGGEALNRGATVSFQVGQTAATTFSPKTGHCGSCHEGRSDLAVVNHGIGDRRTCFGCHTPLSFEPDNALDWRVHSIHSRSERFPGTFERCGTCHLSPPNGPARGAFFGDPDGQ